ncbi:MAG: DUF2179 domain-containing protein [Anaerolineales bacterium]
MQWSTFYQSGWFQWVVLPLLIILARICDVTLGTMRIVFLSRGKRSIAPLLGFMEVLIWLIAISQIMRNLSNPITYLAYATGFASGNYIGLWLEEKLAIGMVAVRVFLKKDSEAFIHKLQEAGYGVTRLSGMGTQGAIDIIYTLIRRRSLPEVINMIHQVNPKAFYAVEEIRSVSQGVFPVKRSIDLDYFNLIRHK